MCFKSKYKVFMSFDCELFSMNLWFQNVFFLSLSSKRNVIISLFISSISWANRVASRLFFSLKLKFWSLMLMIKRKILIFDQNEIFCKHESTITFLFLLEHTSKICLKSSQKQIILLSNEKISKASSKSNMIRLTIIMSHLRYMKISSQKINLTCLINLTRFVFLSISYKLWEFESRDILKRAWAI